VQPPPDLDLAVLGVGQGLEQDGAGGHVGGVAGHDRPDALRRARERLLVPLDAFPGVVDAGQQPRVVEVVADPLDDVDPALDVVQPGGVGLPPTTQDQPVGLDRVRVGLHGNTQALRAVLLTC
jgi:hypothetical protein